MLQNVLKYCVDMDLLCVAELKIQWVSSNQDLQAFNELFQFVNLLHYYRILLSLHQPRLKPT